MDRLICGRLTLVIIVFVIALTFCDAKASAEGFPPPFYSAKEIRATVVDEETGRPLEGVVVVAQWVLRRMYGDGPRLHVTEAVTDAQGQFFIPGWGPKPRVPLMELQDKSPQLLLFKHGFVPLRLRNTSKKEFARYRPNYLQMTTRQINEVMGVDGTPDQAVQESFWDGMTIQLEPFRATPDQWVDLLWSLSYSVAEEDVNRTRRYFEAILAERAHLNLKSLDPTKRDKFESMLRRIERLLNRG